MPTFTDKRSLITIIAIIGILLTFWLGSRYPALDLKAINSSNQLLADQLGFDAIIPVTDEDSIYRKIGATTINWMDNNKRGMTFGLLLAAAMLSLFSLLNHLQFRSRFANTLFGILVGAPLGVCVNCATPIAQGMIISGSRLETALAALFSSPTLNVIILSILITMFPVHLVAVKIGLTLVFILIVIPLITYFYEHHQPAKLDPEGLIDYTDKHSALHVDDNTLDLPYGWLSSSKWFVISYIENLFKIIKLALPLMVLAGFLGAVVVSLISWEDLVNWLDSLDKTEQILALSATSLFGLFLPVPIAFDVMFPAALQETGLPAMYVMALLFSLGTFSIYPFMVIGRTVSWKLAIHLSIVLWLFTIGGAYIAGYFEASKNEKLQALAEELINIEQLEPVYEKPANGKNLQELSSMLSQQKLVYEKTGRTNDDGISIHKLKYLPGSTPKDKKLFHRESSLKSGFLRVEKQSPLIYLGVPQTHSRPLAGGDIHGDGWPDLVLGTSRGIQLYANQQGQSFQQQEFDIPALKNKFILNVALIDLNNDNALDLFVATLTAGNYLFYNHKGGFDTTHMKKLPGDKMQKFANAIAFHDIGNDGDLDIILGNYWSLIYPIINNRAPMAPGKNQILISEGSSYLLQMLPGQAGATLTILSSDLDNNGHHDISIGNDFLWPDIVYMGYAGNEFHMVNRNDNLYPPLTRFTMSIDSADIDNDLDLELYYGNVSANGTRNNTAGLDVADSLEEVCNNSEEALIDDCEYFNQLYNHSFRKDVDIADCQAYDDIGTKSDCLRVELIHWTRKNMEYNKYCTDLYNTPRLDGFPRTCTPNTIVKRNRISVNNKLASKNFLPQLSTTDINNLLLTQTPNGKYEDKAETMGVQAAGWVWNAKFADLDNDQWQDLFVATGFLPREIRESNVFYRNDQGIKFLTDTDNAGLTDYQATGSYVYMDMDNDGDLDIITSPFQAPLTVYRNQSSGNHSIIIELNDEIGNASGIGSRITINYGEDKKQLREIKASGGYQSFDPAIAHFGLGRHTEIKQLKIHWSSGETTIIKQPFSAGYRYRISRARFTKD